MLQTFLRLIRRAPQDAGASNPATGGEDPCKKLADGAKAAKEKYEAANGGADASKSAKPAAKASRF